MITFIKDFLAMLIVSIVIVVVVLWLAPRAQASSTGNLVLIGIVPIINELSIAPNNNLNLSIANGETNKLVAIATETSNNALGYTIYAYSSNGGKLVMDTYEAPYTLQYDGTSINLTTVPQQVKIVNILTQQTTDTSEVRVTIPSGATLPNGMYTDTVTFSIVAN